MGKYTIVPWILWAMKWGLICLVWHDDDRSFSLWDLQIKKWWKFVLFVSLKPHCCRSILLKYQLSFSPSALNLWTVPPEHRYKYFFKFISRYTHFLRFLFQSCAAVSLLHGGCHHIYPYLRYDILMICDEVMVGFGRTGRFFGFQHFEGIRGNRSIQRNSELRRKGRSFNLEVVSVF